MLLDGLLPISSRHLAIQTARHGSRVTASVKRTLPLFNSNYRLQKIEAMWCHTAAAKGESVTETVNKEEVEDCGMSKTIIDRLSLFLVVTTHVVHKHVFYIQMLLPI